MLFVLADYKGVARHYFIHDVPRNFWSIFQTPDVDAFPLPDCVKMKTIVRSKPSATAVNYEAWLIGDITAYEMVKTPFSYETDTCAIFFLLLWKPSDSAMSRTSVLVSLPVGT